MKRCGKCSEDKEAGAFSRLASSADGLQAWCKACHKEYRNNPSRRDRLRDYRQEYRARRWSDPDYCVAVRASDRANRSVDERRARRRVLNAASRYGLTADEVRRLRSQTDCQCCGQRLSDDPQHRHIDHCHETGMVRGMVCRQCNLIMQGPAAECIARMQHCIRYLSEYPAAKEAQ